MGVIDKIANQYVLILPWLEYLCQDRNLDISETKVFPPVMILSMQVE